LGKKKKLLQKRRPRPNERAAPKRGDVSSETAHEKRRQHPYSHRRPHTNLGRLAETRDQKKGFRRWPQAEAFEQKKRGVRPPQRQKKSHKKEKVNRKRRYQLEQNSRKTPNDRREGGKIAHAAGLRDVKPN